MKSLKTGKLGYLSLFTVSNILGLYTHFAFVFLVAFQGIYILVMFAINSKYTKKILISLFVIGLSYLTLLIRVFSQAPNAGAWLGKPTLLSIAKVWIMLNSWLYPSLELSSKIGCNKRLLGKKIQYG